MRYAGAHATALTLAEELLLEGDHDWSEGYVERIRAVTQAEVLAAARKYYRPRTSSPSSWALSTRSDPPSILCTRPISRTSAKSSTILGDGQKTSDGTRATPSEVRETGTGFRQES